MRLLKVGRDSSCDIVLHSPNASALHAEITVLNNGDILLEDKNSRNGTFVMNRPIESGVQVSIKRGDAIRFADVELLWSQVPMPEDLSRYKAVYGIGKSMRNEIQISGNTVSRYHATLKIDKKNKAYIQDHSKNGTTVNGERLNYGQTMQIRHTDSIVCGGVPINISQFVPRSISSTVLKVASAVAAVVAVIFLCVKLTDGLITPPWGSVVQPVTTEAMENATACVYGGYYYEVTFNDDPFKNILNEWADKWYVGLDSKGRITVDVKTTFMNPFQYTGTAFFISEHGEMGTNRHIAVPWEYRDAETEELIRQKIEKYRLTLTDEDGPLIEMLSSNLARGRISYSDAQAWIVRFQNSSYTISGKHEYFVVGLAGTRVDNTNDAIPVQVIAESGDPDKDVALIRLKNTKTPDYIVKMGAIYHMADAREDESSLTLDDVLMVVGYPLGDIVSYQLSNGKELHPTIQKASISKTPDNNQIQIQAIGVGGQSGSPVIDSKHRLVGVLCSGFKGTDLTYCCNIKHLVELYNKHYKRK